MLTEMNLLVLSWTTKNVLLSVLIVLGVILVEVIAVSLILRKIYGKKRPTESVNESSEIKNNATDIVCDEAEPAVCEPVSEKARDEIFNEVFGLDKIQSPEKLDSLTDVKESVTEEAAAEEAAATEVAAEVAAEETVEKADIEETVIDLPVDEATENEPVAFETKEEVFAPTDSYGVTTPSADGLTEYSVVKKPSFAGINVKIRYVKSFSAKLCQSNDLLKERYSALKNELLSYKKAKARMSWHFETFRAGRPVIAKFAITGKTLSLYLALDPSEFADTKYHFKDVSGVKKYQAVPMRLKIKSNRSVRWAKELIYVMSEKLGLKRFDKDEVDFYPEYKSLEELIDLKLVKVIKTDDETSFEGVRNDLFDYVEPSPLPKLRVSDAPLAVISEVSLDEAEVIEFKVDEVAATTAEAETNEAEVIDFKADEAEETPAETAETPVEMAETTVEAEETPVEAEETPVEAEETPVEAEEKFKVDEVAVTTDEAETNEAEALEPPIETAETTLEAEEAPAAENSDKEAIETETDDSVTNFTDSKEEIKPLTERDFEIVESITVSKAEKEMTDEKAETLIETVTNVDNKYPKGNKKAIINVDTLSKCFASGDTVNVRTLIKKNLAPKNAGYVKVLGRGLLNKPLIVEANDFTVNAVKMILLTGGRVVQIED